MEHLTRRDMLLRSGALGCSLAASPLVTPVTLASAPWDNRLVVIILRGGMDGLDALRPVGDPAFAELRSDLDAGRGAGLPLDGFYELHPALAPLLPLWQAGEFSAVHATSTPYRDRRSHFDGQDHLEAGFSAPGLMQVRDGWLNRLLQTQSGLSGELAFSVGHGEMLVLRGAADVANWTPEVDLLMSPPTLQLAQMLMESDPLFQSAFEDAIQIAASDGDSVLADMETGDTMAMESMMNSQPKGQAYEAALAKFAAQRLRQDTRIAAFSINGWDSHRGQAALLTRALTRLSKAILALREKLGDVWQKTTVLAMTEFGRTVRLNGTKGTDHGTAGALLLAGGSLKRSQIVGKWPGLDEADLYQRRDLMPTTDVRAHAAWAMRHAFGLDRSTLENQIFPGLDLGVDAGLFA